MTPSSAAASDDEVLFELAVTKAWLRQAFVGLALVGRSSYRGVVEFVRDLLGIAISAGCAQRAPGGNTAGERHQPMGRKPAIDLLQSSRDSTGGSPPP